MSSAYSRSQERTGGRRDLWWKKVAALVLIVSMAAMFLAPAGLADTGSQKPPEGRPERTPSGAALQAASWLVTIPYGALKVAFALLGGAVGSLTYVLSAGDDEAAKAVWRNSMYGTYVITPEHLKGEKPIHFMGEPAPPVPPNTKEN